MALLLRIVSRPKWVPPNWMAPGDIPADALTDLRASNNELSVWRVERDQSNLELALVAAACGREHLDKLDYALFDEQELVPLAIECKKTDGKTACQAANTAMHRDLAELSVDKIVKLAKMLFPVTRERRSEREVKRLLLKALQDEMLDREQMDKKLLLRLESAAT